MIIEDKYNDRVEIWAKDQDFSNTSLWIPNIKNFDGRHSRRESRLLVSSVENDVEGTLKITSGGFLGIVQGRLKIDSFTSNVSKADLDKVIGASENDMTRNKAAIYGLNGAIRARSFFLFTLNSSNNFVRMAPSNSQVSKANEHLSVRKTS